MRRRKRRCPIWNCLKKRKMRLRAIYNLHEIYHEKYQLLNKTDPSKQTEGFTSIQ